jgi:predicted aspartyl protease
VRGGSLVARIRRSILAVALFLVVLASAFLSSFLKVEMSPAVSQWFGIAESSITPSIPALLYIMPWVLLLMLALLLLGLTDLKYPIHGLGILLCLVIGACPVIVYSDVIAKTLRTVKFSSAFLMHTTTEVDLGIWRILLLIFLMGFAFASSSPPQNIGEKIENVCTAIFVPFLAAFILGIIGELAALVTPPSAPSWPFFRYMALSCGYAFASVFSFFGGFSSLLAVDPVPCFFSIIGVISVMVYVIEWLGEKAGSALLYRAEQLTLPVHLPRFSRRSPELDMIPKPTAVTRERDGIYAYVNVYDLERRRCLPIRLLVDTGATVTAVSRWKLKKLGVKPKTKVTATLADGRKIMRDAGYAYVECMGKETIATVAFGEKRDTEVLGRPTFESLGLNMNFDSKPEVQKNPCVTEVGTKPLSEGHAKEEYVEPPGDVETAGEREEAEREKCDILKPFEVFNAKDWEKAVEEANKRGLVAIYGGKDRYDLYGRPYRFYMLPKDVALRLLPGWSVKPESVKEKDFYDDLCSYGKLKKEFEAEDYRLKDRRAKRDLKKQLKRFKKARVTTYVEGDLDMSDKNDVMRLHSQDVREIVRSYKPGEYLFKGLAAEGMTNLYFKMEKKRWLSMLMHDYTLVVLRKDEDVKMKTKTAYDSLASTLNWEEKDPWHTVEDDPEGSAEAAMKTLFELYEEKMRVEGWRERSDETIKEGDDRGLHSEPSVMGDCYRKEWGMWDNLTSTLDDVAEEARKARDRLTYWLTVKLLTIMQEYMRGKTERRGLYGNDPYLNNVIEDVLAGRDTVNYWEATSKMYVEAGAEMVDDFIERKLTGSTFAEDLFIKAIMAKLHVEPDSMEPRDFLVEFARDNERESLVELYDMAVLGPPGSQAEFYRGILSSNPSKGFIANEDLKRSASMSFVTLCAKILTLLEGHTEKT